MFFIFVMCVFLNIEDKIKNPLGFLDDWEDDLLFRYPEKDLKSKEGYRDYDTSDRAKGFEEIEMTANQNPPKRWFKNHEGKQLHLITSDVGVPNSIINHMAFSTKNLKDVVLHLRKNNINYWTDEGEKNIIRYRKDGVRQVKIQDPEVHWIEMNEAY